MFLAFPTLFCTEGLLFPTLFLFRTNLSYPINFSPLNNGILKHVSSFQKQLWVCINITLKCLVLICRSVQVVKKSSWEFVGELTNTIRKTRDTRKSKGFEFRKGAKRDDGALSSCGRSLLSCTPISHFILLMGL